MKQLKNRLYTVSTLVPKGARVADIGTDHGHLPIYLVQNGICSVAIACDIKESPLENAKENIKKVGLSIETRLGAGLDPVSPNEVDCITIAGMGGEVISSILEAAPWVKNPKYTLILQPMTSADSLRRWLCENGFNIVSETACEEKGKVYTVIKAAFCGECFTPDETFCRMGKLVPHTTAAIKYTEKQIRIIVDCINDRRQNGLDTAELERVLAQIEALLNL